MWVKKNVAPGDVSRGKMCPTINAPVGWHESSPPRLLGQSVTQSVTHSINCHIFVHFVTLSHNHCQYFTQTKILYRLIFMSSFSTLTILSSPDQFSHKTIGVQFPKSFLASIGFWKFHYFVTSPLPLAPKAFLRRRPRSKSWLL